MKISRKNLGRVASAFVATAMLAALSAMPASAETLVNGAAGAGNGTTIGSLEFNSELWLPTDTSVPDVTFTYTLAGADATSDPAYVDGSSSIKVKSGTDTITGSGTISKTVDFDSSDNSSVVPTGKDKISKVTEKVTIPFDTTFTFGNAGVYKYTLTQSMASNSTTDFHQTANLSRVVYLFVGNVGSEVSPEYKVTGVAMVDDDQYSTSAKSKGVFTNFYLLNGNPDDPDGTTPTVQQNTLKISNAIDGAMGDKSESFKFSFTINNSDSSKKYTYKVFGKDGSEKAGSGTASAGTAVTDIALGDGEYIMLYGLSTSDTFNVSQEDVSGEGYTTKINGQVTNNVTDGDLEDYNSNDYTLAFTNTRDAITPTGVVMNVAPYLLLVVVAAAAGFVFLHKRRED